MEPASGRRIYRTRRLSGENLPVLFPFRRIRFRCGGQQEVRVGMFRVFKNILRIPNLTDFSKKHYAYPVRNIPDNGKVM